jgi:hypothetical protein
MSEDCYAVIQFWDALLSISHTRSFPTDHSVELWSA